MSASPEEKSSLDTVQKAQYWARIDEVHNTLKHQSSELSTSGDELLKVRKPYTITKQRERWTEEEHQKFLEALKLYGRAWRRIEEHIGTKTAVQIRSHAQKFFSKLEKEQATGSVLPGAIQDIDIPPPRPKRKPSHPYPRKAAIESPAMVSSAAFQSGLLVRPSLEPAATGELGSVLERCKAELMLFGQTVVPPTAVAARLEGKVHDAVELLQDTSKISLASDISMPVSENNSSNGQSDNRKENKPAICETSSSIHHFPAVDLPGLYHSKFWESSRAGDRPYPFNHGLDRANLLQYAYNQAATPPLWPNFFGASLNEITASVMRAIMTGTSPDTLAAATIAAASAWWASQGSLPPSFAAPTQQAPNAMNRQAEEAEEMAVDSGELQDDDDTTPTKIQQSFKRQCSSFEDLDGGKRRVRSRSCGGSSAKPEAVPPSSSGSDDGNAHTEVTDQRNGDGDASGNSGPSSNSSRCGAAVEVTGKSDESSFDKEVTEEEEAITEEAPKAVKDLSFQQHASSHHNAYRSRKGQRIARPSRSSGSDGEQRKEVSQEGRMAFQALFSHQKLPQTFLSLKGSRDVHHQAQRFLEGSDLECARLWHEISNHSNPNTSRYLDNNSLRISRVESEASDASLLNQQTLTTIAEDEERSETSMKMMNSTSKSRRRSGFVPYRRTGIAAAAVGSNVKAVVASNCGLEETQLLNSAKRLVVDEEVKASSCS